LKSSVEAPDNTFRGMDPFGYLPAAWWNNNYDASKEIYTGTDKYDLSKFPKVVHTVWMANPLKPYVLASIDSIARFLPDLTYKLHILTPDGANHTVLEAVRLRIEDQIKPFLDLPEFDIQVILHDNVEKDFIGTPLDNIGFTQRHLGGHVNNLLSIINQGGDREGTPHGEHQTAMVHASDVFRVVLLYKEGGIYMDTDHFILSGFWPLVENMGSFLVCETRADNQPDGRCKLLNGFVGAFPPGHMFFKDALTRIATLAKEHAVNGIFPIRKIQKSDPKPIWWTAVGPNLMSVVKNKWIDEGNDLKKHEKYKYCG